MIDRRFDHDERTLVDPLSPGSGRDLQQLRQLWIERLQRLSSLDGDFGSIIANDNELNGGPMIVDIKSSDAAFQISGDCTVTKQWCGRGLPRSRP